MNEIVQTWFPVVAWLFGVAGLVAALYFRVTARDEAKTAVAESEAETKVRIDGLEAQLKEQRRSVIDHDRRLIGVEKGLEAFPTTRDISNLKDQLSEISGNLKGLTQQVIGIDAGQKRSEASMEIITGALITANKEK